jgi:hypothetical protein
LLWNCQSWILQWVRKRYCFFLPYRDEGSNGYQNKTHKIESDSSILIFLWDYKIKIFF